MILKHLKEKYTKGKLNKIGDDFLYKEVYALIYYIIVFN